MVTVIAQENLQELRICEPRTHLATTWISHIGAGFTENVPVAPRFARITAVSDDCMVEFGQGLPLTELTYLLALLKQEIIG